MGFSAAIQDALSAKETVRQAQDEQVEPLSLKNRSLRGWDVLSAFVAQVRDHLINHRVDSLGDRGRTGNRRQLCTSRSNRGKHAAAQIRLPVTTGVELDQIRDAGGPFPTPTVG